MVALNLGANHLKGSLNESLGRELQYLARIDLSSNELEGEIPESILSLLDPSTSTRTLTYFNIDNNKFEYHGKPGPLDRLFESCSSSRLECGGGIPPEGCHAFGATRRQALNDKFECLQCNRRQAALLTIVGVSTFMVLTLVSYLYLISKYPSALKRWVSTVSIIISHVQTVSIVGNLRLAWPQSVTSVTSIFSLDILETDFLRPECLFDRSTRIYFLFNLVKFAVVFAGLGGLSVAQMLLSIAQRAADAGYLFRDGPDYSALIDLCAFADSVVLQVTIVVTWRWIFELIQEYAQGEAGAEVRTVLVALSLLGLQLLLGSTLLAQLRGMHLHQAAEHKRRFEGKKTRSAMLVLSPFMSMEARQALSQRIWRVLDALALYSTRGVDIDRIIYRLSYVTDRFAEHAPHWQFVVWTRQLLLTIVTFVPDMFTDGGFEPDPDQEKSAAEYNKGSVWSHAIAAILIILASWQLHRQVKPYEYSFQNFIESFLFVTDVMVIFLCCVYTFLKTKLFVVEAALVSVLLVSLLVACGYLTRQARLVHRKRMVQRAAEKVQERLVDFATDITREASFRIASIRMSVTGSRKSAEARSSLGERNQSLRNRPRQPVWKVWTGGRFLPYKSKRVQDALERSYQDGKRALEMRVKGKVYVVQLSKSPMVQVQVGSVTKRTVKRELERRLSTLPFSTAHGDGAHYSSRKTPRERDSLPAVEGSLPWRGGLLNKEDRITESGKRAEETHQEISTLVDDPAPDVDPGASHVAFKLRLKESVASAGQPHEKAWRPHTGASASSSSFDREAMDGEVDISHGIDVGSSTLPDAPVTPTDALVGSVCSSGHGATEAILLSGLEVSTRPPPGAPPAPPITALSDDKSTSQINLKGHWLHGLAADNT